MKLNRDSISFALHSIYLETLNQSQLIKYDGVRGSCIIKEESGLQSSTRLSQFVVLLVLSPNKIIKEYNLSQNPVI